MTFRGIAYSAKPDSTFAYDGVLALKIQKARDNLMCNCGHKNLGHGYGHPISKPWREGSQIGLGHCGVNGCNCSWFLETDDE